MGFVKNAVEMARGAKKLVSEEPVKREAEKASDLEVLWERTKDFLDDAVLENDYREYCLAHGGMLHAGGAWCIMDSDLMGTVFRGVVVFGNGDSVEVLVSEGKVFAHRDSKREYKKAFVATDTHGEYAVITFLVQYSEDEIKAAFSDSFSEQHRMMNVFLRSYEHKVRGIWRNSKEIVTF